MEVGTPLTLALQPGAGEGDGLGLGLGLGDGAGDGPVTVLGAVSFLLDPAQADASSANVSRTTGARNSRFMLGRIASHPPRLEVVRVTPHGCPSSDCKSTSAKHLCAAHILATRQVHRRGVRTLSTGNAQYFRGGRCAERKECEWLSRKPYFGITCRSTRQRARCAGPRVSAAAGR